MSFFRQNPKASIPDSRYLPCILINAVHEELKLPPPPSQYSRLTPRISCVQTTNNILRV